MIDYEPHEIKHTNQLKEIASECTLFLKRNNDFPIKSIDNVALFGNGVRHTVKGGTGSGAVEIHHFINIEEAFLNAGIKIVSTEWLDKYDEIRASKKKDFIARNKKEAKEKKMSAAVYSVGAIFEESEYELNLDYPSDLAIYVLSRDAGEGRDRRPIKGEFYLTDTEIKTIKYLNQKYRKFLLVLNTAAVIEIEPVLEVENILLLSQLGTVTSETLLDIILGNKYPSGKLSTTWARREEYPHYLEFGDDNDTNYKEGIYVGYRYFLSKGIEPLFEFGYGLSYTNFSIRFKEIANKKDLISIKCLVKNIGDNIGKEVVQLYLKKPRQNIDNPLQILVQFAKTKELKPKEEQVLELSFKLSDFASFAEAESSYIIEKGIYLLSLGDSSINVSDVASIEVEDNIVVKKVNSLGFKISFEEEKILSEKSYSKLSKNITLGKDDFASENVNYKKYVVPVDPFINSLNDKDLISMACGNIISTLQTTIGESCKSICGGAGESVLGIKGLDSFNMVDGPAGLRIAKEYIITRKKKYRISIEAFWEELLHYIPKAAHFLFDFEKNRKRKGQIKFQYVSAIPIATALAQSFNRDVLTICGDVVREEMELYGADLWLAPALNIHRNVLCGRNFEYYSEDPFLSGECATAMTLSVQKNPHKGVTLKHLFCNNQETNRTNNSSNISERAFREIYLSGFARTIQNANPMALMMSYNLINGVHTSEHYGLINDVIRCELGYKGLVMTDWIATKQIYLKSSIYPCTYASRNIKNGVNLCMPGGKTDIADLSKALKNKYLTRNELLVNSSIIYETIKKIKE